MESTSLLFPLLLCISHVSATRTCRMSHVPAKMDCSRLKLHHLPVIPPRTRWLDASHNEIKTVSFTERHDVLEILDLSHNLLSNLQNVSLSKLPRLKVLKLNHNNLQLSSAYTLNVFSGVPLQTLHLHHNDVNSVGVYPDSLSSLTRVRELTIDTFKYTTFSHVFSAMVGLKRLLLGFESCKLTELKNETFVPLTNLSVEELSLNHCPLKSIQNNSFAPLKLLRKLYVSHTQYLDPRVAIKSMYGLRNQSLHDLYLDELMDFNIFKTTDLRKFILSKDIMNYVRNVCVANLSLRHNQLLWIDFLVWSGSRFSQCIRYLDLSGNDLYGNMQYMFTLSVFPNLEYLNISRHFVLKAVQYHLHLNVFDYQDKSNFLNSNQSTTISQHLEAFNLSHEQKESRDKDISFDPSQYRDQWHANIPYQSDGQNRALALEQWNEQRQFQQKHYGKGSIGIDFPKSLKFADANGFSVNQLDLKFDINFTNADNLRKFRFAFNQVTVFKTRILGLSALTDLDISGNACGNMTLNFFSELESLERLNMSKASLNNPETYLLENGPRVFKPLGNLQGIDLSSNKLTRINPNMFAKKPLMTINLSNNRFINIPFDLGTTSFLNNLDLSLNLISVLSLTEMEALDRLGFTNNLTVNLKGNTLSCDCDNLDFINWLFNTYASIEDVKTHSLTCIREDGKYSTAEETYRNLMMVWRQCNGRIWLSLSVTITSAFCLSLAFAYIICWRKTLILNTLLRMFGYNNIITQQQRKDFRFDVFLGNSDHDDDLALQAVSSHLENEHKFEVFIPVRDMLPGRSIPQEIVRSVDSSWKIVLVITRAFLQDNWCRFISDYAIYVSTFRPQSNVMLVLFDDVNVGDISPSLLNVVDEDHVFLLREDLSSELDTWSRVSEAVKKDDK